MWMVMYQASTFAAIVQDLEGDVVQGYVEPELLQ
jgi:hypothetical protein